MEKVEPVKPFHETVPVAVVTVSLFQNGSINVHTTQGNVLLSMGMMEMAKYALANPPKQPSPILLPRVNGV